MFDRHSQLAVPPETHFLTHFGRRLPRRALLTGCELASRFTDDLYCRDLKVDRRRLAERLGPKPVALRQFFRDALYEYAIQRGKPGWAEKTPDHLYFIPQIFEWYPDARAICIVRDGRDTALSLRALPWAHRPVRGFALMWREAAAYATRWQHTFPDRFIILKFEELLRDPADVLTRATTFVGLEFEPHQLDPSVSIGLVPEWERKHKGNVGAQVDESRAYSWKHSARPEELRAINSMLRHRLQSLGYECDTETPAWPIAFYDGAMNGVCQLLYSRHTAWLRRSARRLLGSMLLSPPELRQHDTTHRSSASRR